MISNFELIMDFKNVRDFAICMSMNDICCQNCCSTTCEASKIGDSELNRISACRRCWLDFLTSDEGLDLSYLDEEKVERNCKNCGKTSCKNYGCDLPFTCDNYKEKSNGKERT